MAAGTNRAAPPSVEKPTRYSQPVSTAYLIIATGFVPLLVAVFGGLRRAVLFYVALTPLYMYHKSMFLTTTVGGFELQLPTITKDVVGVGLALLLSVAVLIQGRVSRGGLVHLRVIGFLIFATSLVAIFDIAFGSFSQTIVGIRPYIEFQVLGLGFGYLILNQPRGWDRVAGLLLWGCVFIAAVALVQQFVSLNFLITATLRRVYNGQVVPWSVADRALAFFTSANDLGYFMGFGIVLSLWRLLFTRHSSTLYACVVGVLLIPLVLSLSRSALLATGVSVGLLIWVYRQRSAKGDFLLVLGGASFLFLLLFSPLASRFNDIGNNPRLAIWAEALQNSVDSPRALLIGNGVGTLGRFGAQVTSNRLDIGALSAQLGTDGGAWFVDNAAVQAIYQAGILGLFLISWSVYLTLRQVRRARDASVPESETASVVLPATIMTFILAISIFSVALNTYPWSMLFWFCVAGSYLQIYRPDESRGGVDDRAGRKWGARQLATIRFSDTPGATR